MKYKKINNQLCRMVKPEPIFGSTKAPFVIVGKNTKHPTIITQDMDILLRIFLVAYSDEFEIIGYPVEEGSAEWALWQAENGKSFEHKTAHHCRIFTMFSETELRVTNEEGEVVEFVDIDRFLSEGAKDGWQIYEPKPKPRPKPLLADAQVGWLCKLRNGEWRQIKGFGDSWGTNDCLNPNLFTVFLTDGTTRNIYGTYLGTTANPLPNDIISTEPLAEVGTAEWAWQMLILQKPVSHPAEGIWRDTYYSKDGFVRCMAKTGWQLYEEKPETEPPKEPKYKICTRCGGSQSVPKPEVSSTAYTACTKCGGTGFEIAEEPEIVAHKQHANCLVCGKEIEGLLDGHATVSIKRYSISSLYESTYSHYCGKCFLELGFDATERELRNRQQPIAEPEPGPESKPPDFKVGDWVEYSDGTLQQAIIEAYSGQPGEQMVYVWHPQTAHSAKTPLQSITRKLDPSEVVIRIGCLSGTVRQCGDKEEEVFALCTNHNAAVIPFTMCDPATRSLVRQLLKTQEGE